MSTLLDRRDPALIEQVMPGLRWLRDHYFRAEVRGIENLPAGGPALVVMTHGGAPLLFDAFMALSYAIDRHGPHAPYFGLAHDLVFKLPGIGPLFSRLGGLRADPAVADAALAAGAVLIVWPGGAQEPYRPFRDRDRVDFGGRSGFMRLALKHQLPIIPVASVGTHEVYITLAASRRLARWSGLTRLRVPTVPIQLGLPWGLWATGFLPYIPLPAKMTFELGNPLTFQGDPGDADHVKRCALAVQHTMQQMTDRLAAERRFPVIG